MANVEPESSRHEIEIIFRQYQKNNTTNPGQFFMTRILIFLLLIIHSAQVYADSHLGASINMGNFTVSDPDGTTGSAQVPFIGIHYISKLSRNFSNIRLFNSFYYRDFTLDPSATDIGQDVTSITFGSSLQRGFNVSSAFRPFIGAGMTINIDNYSNRQTIDPEGFVSTNYGNRKETSLGLQFDAGLNFKELGDGYFVGLMVNYHLTLSGGLSGLSGNVFLTW